MRVVAYRLRFQPYLTVEYISEEIEALTGFTVDEYYADATLFERQTVAEDTETARRYFGGECSPRETVILRWRHLDGRTITTSHRFTPILENGAVIGMEGELTATDTMDEAI
jgi:hypothetical protein